MAYFPMPQQASTPPIALANTGAHHRNSERNFKSQLIDLLTANNVPEHHRRAINQYLNMGKDEQIGDKLQVMFTMEPPLIPRHLIDEIIQLASRNGVPNSSIDKQALTQPIGGDEAHQRLGWQLDLFSNALGLPRFSQQMQAQAQAQSRAQAAAVSGFRELMVQRWLTA